ncbi:MAG: hypothetical protein ABIT20_01935 [Gemmatimonadaceae bacterium]
MRRVLLAVSLLISLARDSAAQHKLHEYRSEVIVTLPRVQGYGVTLLLDERLDMSDEAPNEVQLGVGIISPQVHRMSVAMELRQVKYISGVVEHRYIPTFYANVGLPAGFDLRTRTRFEARAVAGKWTQRYTSRAAIGHDVNVGNRAAFPYIQSDLYYDSRVNDLNRIDATVGVRVPITSAASIDPFFARSTDSYRNPKVGLTAGVILRVAL